MAKSQQNRGTGRGPNPQNVQKTNEEKLAETRAKAAEGQTKPLPTADDTPPEEKAEVEDRVKVLAAKIAAEEEARKAELEKKRQEIKKLQEELKAAREAEKSEARKAKDAREEAKKLALAERAAKEAELAAADEAIKKAQADLEATEEWSLLEAAKEARAAIGPLPKVPKIGTSRSGSRVVRTSGELTGSQVRAMTALKENGRLNRKQLAEITGQLKGWSKMFGTREGGNGGLCDRGLVELIVHEGESMSYELTPTGLEALEKALAEVD